MSCTAPRTTLSVSSGGAVDMKIFSGRTAAQTDRLGRRADAVAHVDRPAELLRGDAHVLRLVLDELALEDVHRADEIGDELGARELVDLRRRAGLDDLAVIHDADAAGERHRLLLVVGDDDEGDAELVLQADELELRVLAQLLVERAQRLVEQQQLRAA